MTSTASSPIAFLTMRDQNTGRRFEFTAVAIPPVRAAAMASKPNGCEATPVARTAVSAGGKVGCYEHRSDLDDYKSQATISSWADGVAYHSSVRTPDEPRGTAPSPLQQWLADLLDTYA